LSSSIYSRTPQVTHFFPKQWPTICQVQSQLPTGIVIVLVDNINKILSADPHSAYNIFSRHEFSIFSSREKRNKNKNQHMCERVALKSVTKCLWKCLYFRIYSSKGHFRLVSVYRIKVSWIIHEVRSSPHIPFASHTDIVRENLSDYENSPWQINVTQTKVCVGVSVVGSSHVTSI
jgi:hypothetical protein